MRRLGHRVPSRGQTLVEFALVLPVFLVMLIAIFDVGRVIWTRDVLENAAREGARYAIVHGSSSDNACSIAPDSTTDTSAGSCTRGSVVQVAESWASSAGGPVEVTVCYGPGCIGNANTLVTAATTRQPVTVTATTTVNLIAAQLLRLGPFGVGSSVTMTVNF